MKESARTHKQHSQERLEINDTRPSRPVNRDVEVIMIDGKEFKRTPRVSLDRVGRFDLPRKAGFLRRWASTSPHAAHSMQELVDLGYKHATDENGIEIAPLRGGVYKGEEFKLIPIEIPEEIHAKIERDNKDKVRTRNQESLEKMENVDLGNGSMTYVKDSQKFVTKQN